LPILASHPRLRITEIDHGVRLGLAGFRYVEGATLQEAADELVRRMLVVAMAFRASGIGPVYSECRADPGALDLIWKLGDIAAGGGDIRDYLFGPDVPE
jgi:hypothetical protein